MLDYVREGDTVFIESYSRLARNTRDLLNIVDELEKKGVTVRSVKENFDTTTPQGRLMVTFMQGIAQFERDLIKERQIKSGIYKVICKFKGSKCSQDEMMREVEQIYSIAKEQEEY